jgi:hypothetical protein
MLATTSQAIETQKGENFNVFEEKSFEIKRDLIRILEGKLTEQFYD